MDLDFLVTQLIVQYHDENCLHLIVTPFAVQTPVYM
jgi:hypothetical protein